MAFDTGISSAVAQYVYTQSNGAVTEPIGGSYIQAYCEYLGITEPLYNSWLIALCDHFGITAPINGSWTIALANYYDITYPTGGTWWMALAFAGTPGPPPTPPPFIWNLDTLRWNLEEREWSFSEVVADFIADTTTPVVGQIVSFTDLSTGNPTNWAWLTPGGTPDLSNLQNPTIQYNTVGTYTVSLTASKVGSSDIETKIDYITVTDEPIALTTWLTTGLNMSLDETVTEDYSTNALNKNLK